MAIYRLEAKIVSRGGGHSAVAAAAYRTGTKIRDERTERIHDYSGRTKGVVQSVILAPEKAPAWAANTASLWNEVERAEKRKDSQLAREFILAVPRELDTKQQWELVVGWAQRELVSKGMIAEVSLHHPNKRNPHVHILCSTRSIAGEKFSAKKPREWNSKELLLHWRESWCQAENAALEKGGHAERVDHRSLKAQGVDREPEPKIGQESVAMEKRGIDTRNFQRWRAVKLWNAAKPIMKAIWNQQTGIGRTVWEKSLCLAAQMRARANQVRGGFWQKFVQSHPKPTTGPKMER